GLAQNFVRDGRNVTRRKHVAPGSSWARANSMVGPTGSGHSLKSTTSRLTNPCIACTIVKTMDLSQIAPKLAHLQLVAIQTQFDRYRRQETLRDGRGRASARSSCPRCGVARRSRPAY